MTDQELPKLLSEEELRHELFVRFRAHRNDLNLVWDSAHLFKDEKTLQDRVSEKESEHISSMVQLITQCSLAKQLEARVDELDKFMSVGLKPHEVYAGVDGYYNDRIKQLNTPTRKG